MEFTEKELSVISQAEKKVRQAFYLRVLLLVSLLAFLGLFILDHIKPDQLAFISVVLVLSAIAAPQLGGSPKYEQLTALLSSKIAPKEDF